jgi:hypothetical protein
MAGWGDPLAAAEAGEGLAEAMSARGGASAAAAAAAAGGGQGEAAANGEAEQRHLQKIRSTKGQKEVVLPLERAQAIIRWGGVWQRAEAMVAGLGKRLRS